MCKPVCRPWNWISWPLERGCSEGRVTYVRCSSKLAFVTSLVAGFGSGFIAGLALYDKVCPGDRCIDLPLAKWLLTASIPVATGVAGAAVLFGVTCAAAQCVGLSRTQRTVTVMSQVPDDQQRLLDAQDGGAAPV